MQAVSVHGFKWSLVATLVPGRGDMACRERFMNVLDPNRKSGAWTQVCCCELTWLNDADGHSTCLDGHASAAMRPPQTVHMGKQPAAPAFCNAARLRGCDQGAP